MAETRITSTEASDLTNAITDYSVDTAVTDGVSGLNETTWSNDKWEKYFGYFKKIPEVRSITDAIATWTMGKGILATPEDTLIMDGIIGNGMDTFNSILSNLIKNMEIGGDGFAEIIRDKTGFLLNIKPLDPSSIKIVVDKKGLLLRYEQTNKISNKVKKFKPSEIFHLPRNRIADEIHGTSILEALEWIILAKNEVQDIFKTVMQRHIKPVMIFHLDTDDTSEIASFKAKMDKAYADGENMYIPKDVVVPEVLSVSPNATLNPMAWLEYLNKQFYQTSGVPQIIVGGSSEFVEKATSIVYLAFQQTIEAKQLFIEEQVGKQLGLEINLEFPASLENELLSDNKKDGEVNIDQSQTQTGQQN